MSLARCFSLQHQIHLRFLSPDDIGEVKRLCAEWFPIEYPESWYTDITSSKRFYSLAATISSHIIGIIVCEVKTRSRCNIEDSEILASHYPPDTLIAYILSLGVVKDYRRHGIASLLLDNLLSYLTSGTADDTHRCKAVYLHVLASNQTAIRFYERRNFRPHVCLPFYYSIKGTPHDGFSYVLYLNGGQPPSTLADCLRQFGAVLSKLQPCALPQHALHLVRSVWRYLLSGTSSSHGSASSHQVHYS
jgi:ribosomal protein S18 acetylase RimI-like enzyme